MEILKAIQSLKPNIYWDIVRPFINKNKLVLFGLSTVLFAGIYKILLSEDHFTGTYPIPHQILKSEKINEDEDPYELNNFMTPLYMSIVYQSTLGLGDIHPITQTGRNIIMIQSIISMILLVA
jgi:hypothetical protein